MGSLRKSKRIKRLDKMNVEEIEELQRKLVVHGFPILITGTLDVGTITVITNLKNIHKDPKVIKVHELPTAGTYPKQRTQLMKAYDKFHRSGKLIRLIIIYDIFGEYRHIFNIR